jgi:hypothetical protein
MIKKTSKGVLLVFEKSKDFLENLQKRKTELALDIEGIENCSVALVRAEQAQTEYENAAKIASEEKLIFESQLEKAQDIFFENYSYLRVGLSHNLEKQTLLMKEEKPFIFDWLTGTGQFYKRLLADPELFIILSDFSLKKEDIISGQNEINLAVSTYEVLVNNRDGIAAAMKKRDEEFANLINQLSFLQAHIFKNIKDPKKLKNLNLPLVHDEIGQMIMIGMVKDSSIT